MIAAPIVMEHPGRNLAFRELVESLAAGRSNRELSRVCREAGQSVSHASIGDMRWGVVPSYRLLERFAAGLALEPLLERKLFQLAGYERIENMPPTSEQDLLRRALEIVDSIEPTREEEEELEGIELMGYHGPNGSPHDLNRIKRLIIAQKRLRRAERQ